jgi:hypothetical protein
MLPYIESRQMKSKGGYSPSQPGETAACEKLAVIAAE